MKLLISVAMMVLPALALAGEEINDLLEMNADGTVTVINIAGEIEISAWDRNEVRLTGELGRDSEFHVQESGGNVRIEVEPIGKGRRHNYEETDLVLRVPEKASLAVSAVSADIEVDGSTGDRLAAESVSGDVEVRADVNTLILTAVSGDIEFTGSATRSSLETVSGDIEVDGISGDVEVSLVSGDVDLRGGSFSRGRFESVSGTMELYLEIQDGGQFKAETMSGDVIIHLPSSQQGEFRAQTFSGDISSSFGSPQREKHGPGTRLKHVEGSGKATIRVESFSGDVEIGH